MSSSILRKARNLLAISIFIPLISSAFKLEYIKPSSINYPEIIGKFYNLPSVKDLTLLKLTGYQQTEIYTCGPSAVMSVLHYYGKLTDNQMNKTTEMRIAKELGTSLEKGTSPQAITSWFRDHGFQAHYGENGTMAMLQDNIKKGIPTIVEWIDWSGHWVVVAGYNKVGESFTDNKDTIFLADSLAHLENVNSINGLIAVNPNQFNYMWFDVKYFNPGHITKGVYITIVPNTSK